MSLIQNVRRTPFDVQRDASHAADERECILCRWLSATVQLLMRKKRRSVMMAKPKYPWQTSQKRTCALKTR